MSVMSDASSEVEERLSVVQLEDSSATSSKKPSMSYTREFLLSLSELEVCKKLPRGFDESLLSDFDDASNGIHDRQRFPGSSLLQGFKRTEYGSSVPAKGDSGNFPRGPNRWDSRSSVRNDTDSDSESGRRYGSQARRSWQSPPEHDGLLGSGSFPRPTGYAAGSPVPRFRPPNENTHLNRSNEPYQPPRPYKAGPHTRREANDSFNDETFGSADDTNEDRVEEEKKRRVEFELMRKEQQKTLQEKQKSNQGKTGDSFSEKALLDNTSAGKTSSDLEKVLKQTPQDDSSKLSVSSQVPPSRPLVPPGFVSSVVEKSSMAKSLVHAEPMEIGKLEPEDGHQDVKNKAQGRYSNDLHSQTSSTSDIKAEKAPDVPTLVQGADHAKAPRLPDASEVLANGEIMGLDFEVTGPKLLGEPARSTSILDKLFGNASTESDPLMVGNGSTSKFVEDAAKTDDIWSSNTLQSKFSHWFPEEGDLSSQKPNNLLSLIVGGEKSESNVPDVSATGSIFTPETLLGCKTSNTSSSPAEISEQFSNNYVAEAKPAVLTCEDLEQSILSEIGGDSSNSQFSGNEHPALGMKVGPDINNQASHHLLSLLQKGVGSQDAASFPVVEERVLVNENDADGLNSPGKSSLTLESLFGTAFMKELHSAQRSGTSSARNDVPDGLLFPSAMNENGINHFAPDDRISKMDKVGEWLGFNDALKEMEHSKQPAEGGSKFGYFDGGIEVTLPEEDSLINLIDPINAENSMLMRNSGSFNSDFLPPSSRMPVDVFEKLAALGGAPNDERYMVRGHDPRLLHGPRDMPKPEPPYQNLYPHTSSQQLHTSQMNHNRPLFHGLDSHPHLDPQLNFMPPEANIHRDAPTHHQFPANMGHPSFQHPGAGRSGFDNPIPSAILQQMHMAGNLPPPQLARGFSSAAPMPPHPSHSSAGYIQEPNPMQNFPFGQRQSHFGGPGMGATGPELGAANNPPEAFQRLMEMELRANQKPMPPFAAGSPSRGMYGHELDTGFRYR
ncbi:uncharacterized protein [Spinacia oleracea]|uniref:Uncharacterized protein n=1 Tax=Spinacia oleracea TaxID=3562 RepID=A0A9R0IJD2_SPIOL|nr:uncharacterized protein LOC110789987 [Spinacia oleracea]XP_021850418.2 uncharacterized protein LOC110789987 [Spinacia oleracea]XP_021850424.2 uncharacterized protein LOC110789987 [Spinacia oleracea]